MTIYLSAILAVLIAVHLVFILGAIFRRNDFADVFWGPGFTIAAAGALYAAILTQPGFQLGYLEATVLTCVAIWSLRLFLHVGLRTLKKSDEDIRYKNMRAEWGSAWLIKSYFIVFLFQGILMLVIASPLVHTVLLSPRPWTTIASLGFLLWIAGFTIEALSDQQLRNFKSQPANRGLILTTGLWSWSRHPNYFGEVTQWWGLYLMAFDASSPWLIASPLLITFLILKVTGVPLLEELMKSRPGYKEYCERTSLFFLLPPKGVKK
jgi:steroid 5-alpha reductase family enzyme